MKYILKSVNTQNAKFVSNEDGSLTASNVIAVTSIEGAPEGKFTQTDLIPAFSIPAEVSNKDNPAYVQTQAEAYVKKTYPDTV